MAKPSVKTNCVADRYAHRQERIIEFSSRNGGGLISFFECTDGTLSVTIYNHDATVSVDVGTHRVPGQRTASLGA